MTELLKLPPELWTAILVYCDHDARIRLGQTCLALLEAVMACPRRWFPAPLLVHIPSSLYHRMPSPLRLDVRQELPDTVHVRTPLIAHPVDRLLVQGVGTLLKNVCARLRLCNVTEFTLKATDLSPTYDFSPMSMCMPFLNAIKVCGSARVCSDALTMAVSHPKLQHVTLVVHTTYQQPVGDTVLCDELLVEAPTAYEARFGLPKAVHVYTINERDGCGLIVGRIAPHTTECRGNLPSVSFLLHDSNAVPYITLFVTWPCIIALETQCALPWRMFNSGNAPRFLRCEMIPAIPDARLALQPRFLSARRNNFSDLRTAFPESMLELGLQSITGKPTPDP